MFLIFSNFIFYFCFFAINRKNYKLYTHNHTRSRHAHEENVFLMFLVSLFFCNIFLFQKFLKSKHPKNSERSFLFLVEDDGGRGPLNIVRLRRKTADNYCVLQAFNKSRSIFCENHWFFIKMRKMYENMVFYTHSVKVCQFL